jgi:hypothetical protein
VDIAKWASDNEEGFKKPLVLQNGRPSQDRFGSGRDRLPARERVTFIFFKFLVCLIPYEQLSRSGVGLSVGLPTSWVRHTESFLPQISRTKMKSLKNCWSWLALGLLSALVAGCGGSGRDPILGIPALNSSAPAPAPDTTRPRVTLTTPATTTPGPTAGVPANITITAVFTEEMAPASITPASFTVTCALPCVAPVGTVSYAVGSRTALFRPTAALAVGTTYTATITTAATDLTGNALAGNQAPLPSASSYVWTFSTIAPTAPAPVSVLSTQPAAGASNVCTDASINASFQVPSGLQMDPLSVNATTFTVTGPAPGLTPVAADSVVLDAGTGRIATFRPHSSALTAGTTYTARIKGGAAGVQDLAVPANTMTGDFSWNFTAVNCVVPPVPPPVILGAAASFATFGGSAGMTNSGLLTVINGDIGTTAVSTAVTGFHDAGPGCTYTETPLNQGAVNGLIYTAAPPPTVACPSEGTAATFAIATQARADALAAYNALVAMPAGANPGANLAGKTLAPGVYTAPGGSFMIQGGDLTLDAQGDPNAVWVFQMATTLTVGGPGAAAPQSIILAGGAQAKNVFWQVGSAATINAGGGGTMVGTLIAQAGAAFSTAGNVTLVTLQGRVLSLGASVTLVNTVINVP